MSEAQKLLTLRVGLRHEEHLRVRPFHTTPEVDDSWPGFRGMPPVLATSMLIGFVEQTCIQAIRPYLTAGEDTVGTYVEMSHIAATPIGMTATVAIELIEMVGRSLLFRVECHNESGRIGDGLHRRAIVKRLTG